MSNNIDQRCVAPTVLAGRTEGSKVRGFDIINLMTECGYEDEVYRVRGQSGEKVSRLGQQISRRCTNCCK